jgi:uncharacterized LabA/DUF88 family protein
MSQSKSKQRIAVENEIDNYIRNIEVISALTKVFDDYDGSSTIAKKLYRLEGSNVVTPDLVTEIGKYGFVSESKASLPKDQNHWIEYYQQLLKYDKVENWIDSIQNYDIVFVTETTLTRKFYKFIENQKKDENYKFIHKLAFIDSNKEDKNIVFITLKKVHGDDLSHPDLSERLSDGTRVALQHIVREMNATKFLDAHPHVVYTMEIMWDYVFFKMIDENQIKESVKSKISLKVNIDEVLSVMRLRCAPASNPDLVRREWIKEALDTFGEIRIGRKNAHNDLYEIYFKKPRSTSSQNYVRNWLLALWLEPNKHKVNRVAEKKANDRSQSKT